MVTAANHATLEGRHGTRPRADVVGSPGDVVGPWLRAQAINVTRHAAALRPFKRGEFGGGPAAPSEAHLQVVNQLLATLRRELIAMTRRVSAVAADASADPVRPKLQRLSALKDRAHTWVRAIEKIWDFYFELFGQRQSAFADWLLSCDRIALDCYQTAFLGLGKAKSVPAPPPFAYMRTGFSPATYRRGIPLSRLGHQLNPFPLIQIPYHRLVNPWTLGAMLHEVSHNLQNDLGVARAVPAELGRRLVASGVRRDVAAVWARWNREIFADMAGLLLGGPGFVGSLLDILARAPAVMADFNAEAPHPTPVLRALLSFELLRRIGFAEEARRYGTLWRRMFGGIAGTIPRAMWTSLDAAVPTVVDAMCFTAYPALGDRALAQVIRFERKEQQMIEEAAGRLAAGTDPGVVPARFLICAARVALDRRFARPEVITENFYRELTRR
jgi:hypothetical protein